MESRLKPQSEYLESRYGFQPKGLGTIETQMSVIDRLRNRSTFTDDEFSSFLEQKKREVTRQQNQAPTERTPTYYEMRRVNAGEKIDFSIKDNGFSMADFRSNQNDITKLTPSSPVNKTNIGKGLTLDTLDKSVASALLTKDDRSKKEATTDLLNAFLTGGEASKLKREINPDNVPAVTGGVLGFLYGTILTSDEKEEAERYEKLLSQGASPERAYQIASAWSNNKILPPGVTEEEKKAMRNYSIGKGVFIGLELLDILLIGKPVNTALKGLTRGSQRQLFVELAETTNMAQARALLKSKYPEISGTEGADELIRIARESSKYDSWKKTLATTKTGREILEGRGSKAPVRQTTEAQRVFFENGVPVLRGGAATDNVADIVSIRDETTSAVKGEREGARLSTDQILNDEIKAGSLPFKTTAEATVDVFTVRNIKKPSLGERVTLTEGVARASLQGGADVNKLTLKVDDLVRLDDGTFVYAPKKAVTTEFSPQIKAVQDKMRQKTIEAEKRRTQLARDIKTTERQLFEADRRIARQQAEAVLKKEAEKLNIAKNSKEQIAKARLKEAGMDAPKKAEKSSFEAARQWISGGNRRAMTKEVIEDLDAAGIKPTESLTLYRIGDVDSSKFQSWTKKKPTGTEEFTTKKFTPEEMLIDTTDPRFVSQFSGDELKAIKQFNKIESEVIVKAERRITAKQVDEINAAKTSYKEGVKEVKQFENSIPDKPKRNFDPIESDGKKLSTKMNEDIARRTGYEEGVPPEFRQATIKKEYRQLNLQKDQQNAVQMVIEDPIGVYEKFIADIDLGSKATRASIGNALISHPQIASSPFRLDEVYRALQGTRQAQEFVARRNIGDLDVVNFINNLNKRGEEILAKRGVDLKAEIEAAWKAAGLEKAKGQKAISRKSVENVLKTNLC